MILSALLHFAITSLLNVSFKDTGSKRNETYKLDVTLNDGVSL